MGAQSWLFPALSTPMMNQGAPGNPPAGSSRRGIFHWNGVTDALLYARGHSGTAGKSRDLMVTRPSSLEEVRFRQ